MPEWIKTLVYALAAVATTGLVFLSGRLFGIL